MAQAKIAFELVSPEKLLLAAQADMVTVPGTEGYMGVMAGHSPLVSTLRAGMIDVSVDGKDDRYFIRGGFAEINPAQITVLADEAVPGVFDAVRYIEELRQTGDLSSLPVGRRVVVIGGGMTAIDIAVQMRKLGADEVTMLYRRGPEHMGASDYERELAQSHGVNVRFWSRPRRLILSDGEAVGIEIERTELVGGKLVATGQTQILAADMVFKAIGQTLVPDALDDSAREILDTQTGKLRVDENRRTSLAGVWAGGDCVGIGKDLTVAAVQDGKLAAIDIDRFLRG